jgi:aconitate decarboxylase
MTKALHCADAAANGLQAAMLAASGFSADADALGDARGWGASLFGATFDPTHLLEPIGIGRALSPGPAWKLFPSQFATHFAITAALAARDVIGLDPESKVARVELRAPAMPYIDRPSPRSGLEGKFSWQYTAAVALLDGKVGPASFKDERRFKSDVISLLDRTTLVNDPTISGRFDQMHVDIAVELNDGTIVKQRCGAPLGSWSRPVPGARVIEKFRELTADVLGQEKSSAIEDAVTAPGDFHVCALMALLA